MYTLTWFVGSVWTTDYTQMILVVVAIVAIVGAVAFLLSKQRKKV